MRDFLKRFRLFLESIITVILYGISRPINFIKTVVRYAMKNPAQILAPIGVLVCSALMLATPEDSKLDHILMAIQTILIFIQFGSLVRTIKAGNIHRLKEDKERLQLFFESTGLRGLLGSIRFLSIYKDRWPRAWYYHLRGITRLSLYRWHDTDDIGSYTKFQVNVKDLFHLQLKGCIDTEDPDKAVEGINHIAKEYLTK